MNNIAQFGFVVTPGEMEENQREIQAELDMWNVIMAFKDSFRLLFRYLKNNLNALVEDIELESLLITVPCRSLKDCGKFTKAVTLIKWFKKLW